MFCIFGEVDHEQQQGSDGTKNDERPGQGHEMVWGCVEDSAMVEMVEDDDEGVVEKMGANVDKQRARAVEEVAQQRPHQQTGHEAVEVEMGQGEDQGRDEDGGMGVAEPAVQYLLQAPPEEKLLTHRRDQGHDQELEDEVGDGGKAEHEGHLLLGTFGEGSSMTREGSEVPGFVPRSQEINERDGQ